MNPFSQYGPPFAPLKKQLSSHHDQAFHLLNHAYHHPGSTMSPLKHQTYHPFQAFYPLNDPFHHLDQISYLWHPPALLFYL